MKTAAAAAGKPPSASPTAANLGFEAKLWLAADSRSEAETAEGNWSRDDVVRWQPSGARQTAEGSPQGERSVHQFGAPARGNVNFAWMQHVLHHLARRAWPASPSPGTAWNR